MLNMEAEVKESIKRFEDKQEFREVRKLTRESFREDQTHLNIRMSKFQGKPPKPDQDSIGDPNGDDSAKSGSASVSVSSLDLKVNGGGSTSEDVDEKGEFNGHVNGGFNGEEDSIISDESDRQELEKGKIMTNNDNKPVVNGHAKRTPLSVSDGDRLSDEMRGSSMVDLRRTGGRLYEKNEKLTPNSSHYWDKISLKGGRAHLHRTIENPYIHENIAPIPPEAEVHQIPSDGNLKGFSVDQMTSVLRMLKTEERTVQYLRSKMLDGKRFSTLTDKNLEDLRMKNPIVCYFRDRSSTKKAQQKSKAKFML